MAAANFAREFILKENDVGIQRAPEALRWNDWLDATVQRM